MMNTEEKRHFTRISFDSPIQVEQNGQQWQSEVVDISLKGVLLKEDGIKLKHGEQAKLTIQLGDTTKIEMLAHWDHSDKGCCGLHWTKLDIESMMHLRRLLELNYGDSHLLERELEQLSIH